MSIEEQQLSPEHVPQHAQSPARASAATAPLALVGLSVVQPHCAPLPFAERWFRAQESKLYRQAIRKTGRRQWDLSRFSVDGGLEAAKAGYRNTLNAVGLAAKQAMAAAELSCGRRSSRERLGLVYFDFWGQSSHLEQSFSWRDSFDLDVIPKFLLREHGIDGYSCKIQASRSAFVQALRVARELLLSGDVDRVLLGGVFRFYPVLGFAEAIGNAEQERRWLGKGGQHDAPIVERAGFMVLTRQPLVSQGQGAPVLIGAPQYLGLPAGRDAAAKQLTSAWAGLLPESRALVYGGLYPSSLLGSVEGSVAAGLSDQLIYENLCRRFGDSGSINPMLALQRYAERKSANAAGDALPALLSLSDSTGGTWLLRCD